MGAEARSVRRGERLDGISLVEESLVVELAQKVPESLYIAVVIGDVRVVHVHPVAYPLGHLRPFAGVFHHLAAAGVVVFGHGNLLADVLLMDAELLLHTDFHRESVGIPACAAGDLVACLGLVAADCVLDGTGHHMMDARLSVG